MAGQKPTTARTIAMAVLNQFDPKRNYAGPILNKLLHKTSEKQRATDLVFGTIRNRSAIDMVIAKLANCPIKRIPAKPLNVIRIGAYELIYSPATPDYSIVNEAVENAKAAAGKKQTGFVNAALRQITRHIINRQIQLSQANTQRTLPQTPTTGCEFDTDILPDPEARPADYLSPAFSLPKWLIANWLAEFGAELTQQICFANNRKPSIYIRPNTMKITAQKLAENLHTASIDVEVVPDSEMIKIKSPKDLTQLPGFKQGQFTVQDISAYLPVHILKPKPDWIILDLCAAPGVKTTQLAELTDDKAKIIATDIDSERLEKVKENTTRLGLNSISIVAYEQLQQKTSELGPFDAVLLDVPCSNTGVLAKRIEARYRIRPKIITELTKTQSKLFETAAKMIKPQGKICYSTCSIQASENSELVRRFLQKNCQLELKSEKLTLPSAQGFDHDGGYIAIITGGRKVPHPMRK